MAGDSVNLGYYLGLRIILCWDSCVVLRFYDVVWPLL